MKQKILYILLMITVLIGGNAEAWAPFHKWAVAHKVDTGWYKALLEREKGQKCKYQILIIIYQKS